MNDKLMSIKEIERMLKEEQYTNENWDEWKKDARKGVARLLAREEKKEQEKRNILKMHEEMSVLEAYYREKGSLSIAGVDEVGRGPLAGPVVASAVILNPEVPILGLQDSKKLSQTKLNALFERIHKDAIAIGVGIISAAEIDELNIYQATKKAMQKAVKGLQVEADFLLVDAMHIPLKVKQESLIKGDARSVSIAAASIVAKVTRDRMMVKLAETYPQYGFERHVGYGTKEHLTALDEFGITAEHRKSFSPVRDRLSV